MSTKGSPMFDSFSATGDISSQLVALRHTVTEAPQVKANQCADGSVSDEEETARIHEQALFSKAEIRIIHCEAVLHSDFRIGQTCHQFDIAARLASGSACENLFGESGVKMPCRVAVIGAGGFIASWIVKLLLQRGFYVRGALRHLDDEHTAHLRSLEGASERLELRKANILHLPSLVGVVEGCEGVFHTACPVLPSVSDPEAQMLRPAVEGTLNVLRACTQAHVKRVVLTSSVGAVYMNPNSSPEQVLDENCWSDEIYLRDSKEWYCLAKLLAERTAWDYASTHNVNLVTVCPSVTLGTMLQPRVNQSSTHILKYLNGSTQTYANLCQAYVDVEDAAEAHVLAFESPTASGRYLCCKWSMHRGDVVDKLLRMCPHYPIPTRCKDEGKPKKVPLRFSNHKVEQLGLQFTPFHITLRNAVASLQAQGSLPSMRPPCSSSVEDSSQSSTSTGSKL